MLIRVRTNLGTFRVSDLDERTATVRDVLDRIEERRPDLTATTRGGGGKPLSFDPNFKRPLDVARPLSEQNVANGDLLYCSLEDGRGGGTAETETTGTGTEESAARGPPGDHHPGSVRFDSTTIGGGIVRAEGGARGAGEGADRRPSLSGGDDRSDESVRPSRSEPTRIPGGPTSSAEEESSSPPTCRICLGEGYLCPTASAPSSSGAAATDDDDDPNERLIAPCRCRGTIRYVHVSCLNQWRRSAHGRSDSAVRCGQCGYTYDVRQTSLALFLMSDGGAKAVAAITVIAAVHLLGLLGYATLTEGAKRGLYRWLRIGYRSRRKWLIRTSYGQIVTLGGAALGFLTFAHYAAGRVWKLYTFYRQGLLEGGRFQMELAFLAFWVHAEVNQNESGRGLAVMGFVMACVNSYEGAMVKAKHAAQWLGETILEPSADEEGDRRQEGQAHRQET